MIWPAAGPWQVRVVPHPDPLYHVESDPGRLAEGMYDKMGALGAHEVVVETPQHDRRLSLFSDEIGRAAWRERGVISVVAGSFKKKNDEVELGSLVSTF